ncbi:MAG: hypothetical protein ACT4PX_01740, partial [Actinomycetota bacterium]
GGARGRLAVGRGGRGVVPRARAGVGVPAAVVPGGGGVGGAPAGAGAGVVEADPVSCVLVVVVIPAARPDELSVRAESLRHAPASTRQASAASARDRRRLTMPAAPHGTGGRR